MNPVIRSIGLLPLFVCLVISRKEGSHMRLRGSEDFEYMEFSADFSSPYPLPSPSPHVTPLPTWLCYDPDAVDEGIICPLYYDPVCGCDGIEYSNECFARRQGILRWDKGRCLKQALPTMQPTNVEDFPSWLDNCIEEPSAEENRECIPEIFFVCGCNGLTYHSPCAASKSGIVHWTVGKCP